MNRMKFKSCPRCKGDLLLDHDIFNGWCETCLQCGFVRYLNTIVDAKEHAGIGEVSIGIDGESTDSPHN